MVSNTAINFVTKICYLDLNLSIFKLFEIEFRLDMIIPVLKNIFGSCDLIFDHLTFPWDYAFLIVSSLLQKKILYVSGGFLILNYSEI